MSKKIDENRVLAGHGKCRPIKTTLTLEYGYIAYQAVEPEKITALVDELVRKIFHGAAIKDAISTLDYSGVVGKDYALDCLGSPNGDVFGFDLKQKIGDEERPFLAVEMPALANHKKYRFLNL